jgi:hypothetical protein
MKEIPFRACSSCTHIEHCPEPIVNEDGKALPPFTKCPRPEKIKLTPIIRDMLPYEYFENEK